jgi:hypothetical protein
MPEEGKAGADVNRPSQAAVADALDRALSRLLAKDAHLLRVDANERSITHRLAMYLQELFPRWSVDCEYNRNFDDPKRLDVLTDDGKTSADDTEGTTVFPDIIVHRRNTDDNLLVVEVKKTTSMRGDGRDMEKLNGFRAQLRYGYAAFVKLRTGTDDIGVDQLDWVI